MSTRRNRLHHGPLRLSPPRRRSAYLVGWGLWLSGVLWLLFHYFLMQSGPFGPQPHPLEIWWLRLHAAFGFLAIWTFGMVWSAHIVGGWFSGRQRWTGGNAFAVLGLLIISGFLTYYLTDDRWHNGMVLAHWVVGLALPVVMALHIVLGRRPRNRAGADPGTGGGPPDQAGA